MKDVPTFVYQFLHQFQSDINQAERDESWAFSDFTVYPKTTLATLYKEDEAEPQGWQRSPPGITLTSRLLSLPSLAQVRVGGARVRISLLLHPQVLDGVLHAGARGRPRRLRHVRRAL